ncbi:MAG: hypothetical protein RLZZ616_1802 [Pseudomonadota bacterium]|jgi:hypothetical protein
MNCDLPTHRKNRNQDRMTICRKRPYRYKVGRARFNPQHVRRTYSGLSQALRKSNQPSAVMRTPCTPTRLSSSSQ